MKRTNSISDEYLLLWRVVTDTEEQLSAMRKRLIAAQQEAEEMYISEKDSRGPHGKGAFHPHHRVGIKASKARC